MCCMWFAHDCTLTTERIRWKHVCGAVRGWRKPASDSYSIWRGFPTRMVYLYYISCLRYTILVGNPRWICRSSAAWTRVCLRASVCVSVDVIQTLHARLSPTTWLSGVWNQHLSVTTLLTDSNRQTTTGFYLLQNEEWRLGLLHFLSAYHQMSIKWG